MRHIFRYILPFFLLLIVNTLSASMITWRYHILSTSIENKIYFYHGDHLGSAHWITDSSSVPIQYIHYAPYGELIVNQKPYTYDERYKFTGKERDSETGYDYFGARYYWSTLGIFTSSDPLSGKYPWITSYAYCANNPVKYIDPDGRVVVAHTNQARRNISLTLTPQERKFLHFKKDGSLDFNILKKGNFSSHNYNALKTLAESHRTYHFLEQSKDHSGKEFTEPSQENSGSFYRGVTEFPNAEHNPSPDNDVWIITSSLAEDIDKVINTSHEGFGHAYMYEKTNGDVNAASHHYEPDVKDEEGNVVIIFVDKNYQLQQYINKATHEAQGNYQNQ